MKARNWTHFYPKYAGKWIAIADDQEQVVASAKTLKQVMVSAKKLGYELPLVYKVPTKMLPYVG